MRNKHISKLLRRYLDAVEEGREPYFDADEIDCLLDGFEEADDFTHYGKLLSLGMKLHPMNDSLKVRKCKFHLYGEEYNEALTLLDTLVDNNDEELDMIRLECYCALGEYTRLLEHLDTLQDNDCEYLQDLYEYMAPLFTDMDMYERAYAFIDRGLSLFPDSLLLKEELCFVYEMKGHYGKAIQLCNELIDQEPYSPDLWAILGRLYSLSGQFEKAIDSFDFAITCSDEPDIEIKILKAYCLFMNESYQKAIDVYMEVAVDEESIDRIKPLMAECYMRLEDFDEAYYLLKDIINKKKENMEATSYINFVRCCVETDREKEASVMLKNAASIFPDNVRVLSLLALSYLEKNDDKMVISIINRIFKQMDQLAEISDLPEIRFRMKQEQQRYVPIKDLARDYLNNKDNNN